MLTCVVRGNDQKFQLPTQLKQRTIGAPLSVENRLVMKYGVFDQK